MKGDSMKIHVVRDKSGDVIGTYEAGEIQATSGTVEVSPVLEEGQNVESIEIMRHETFDVDALHKSLTRRKK
jgi:hypothetical protein